MTSIESLARDVAFGARSGVSVFALKCIDDELAKLG